MSLSDSVPSAAFDVLQRNAEDLDKLVNGSSVVTNRVGDQLTPVSVLLQGLGYIDKGTFTAGATLTTANDILQSSGEYYRWTGALPKTVTAGSSPTPAGVGGWVSVGDASLRAALAAANSTVSVGGVEAGKLAKKSNKQYPYASLLGCIPDYSGSTGTDNRALLQSAINAAASVGGLIIDGQYGISFDGTDNGRGLSIPSNFELMFTNGSSISALAHNNSIYQMLRIWSASNVKITNATLNGRRDLNAAVTGEFGMGIDIRASSDVIITNPVTNNMWGDGIYLGRISSTSSVRIIINNPRADNCRRQGCSITSASDVVINNPEWTNTNGAPPQAGLDIEPNGNDDTIGKIRIVNPKTVNNTGAGILVYMGTYAGAVAKTVDISIDNHTDDGSGVGAKCDKVKTSLGAVNGSINFNNPIWRNSKTNAFLQTEWDENGPKVVVTNPTVVDSNRTAQSSPRYGSPFCALRDSGSPETYKIGNLHIVNPSVVITSGSIPRLYNFSDAVNGNSGVGRCDFIDPLKISTSTNFGLHQGVGAVTDRMNQIQRAISGTSTINFGEGCLYAFPSASTTLTLQDGLFYAGGPDLVFITTGTNTYTITLQGAGYGFVGLTSVTSLRCVNNAGSYVRLRPLGGNKFLIVERVGLWTEIP